MASAMNPHGPGGILGRMNPIASSVPRDQRDPIHAAHQGVHPQGGPGSRSRAVVPLGILMRPLYLLAAAASSLFSMLWRLIMRILRKIAALKSVELEGPAGANHSASASFAGETDAVRDAADLASSNIGQTTDLAGRIARDNPDFKQALSGEGSRAYLQIALKRIGHDLKSSDGLWIQQKAALYTAVMPAAQRLGTDPDELIALLMRPVVDDTLLGMDAARPALRERAIAAQQAHARVEQLREMFVDYCVVAVDPPLGDPDGKMQSIVNDALRVVADSDLTSAVEKAQASAAQESEARPSSGIVAKETGEQGATVASEPAPPRRRRFGIIAVGEADALNEEGVVVDPAGTGAGPEGATLPPVPLDAPGPMDIDGSLSAASERSREA